MTGRVHQAYYGEFRGGHDLLATSAPGAEYVQNLKWLTDRPSAGTTAWTPYLSGFPWEEFYVFMRTFSAPARPGLRGGFVFTHALFLPAETAAATGDLRPLLSLLVDAIPTLDSTLRLPLLEEPIPGSAPYFPPDARARSAARALLSRLPAGRPVVWLGQEGFDALVIRLWAGLWPQARVRLSFRISLDPADAERGNPTIVCTPLLARTRWTGFPIVDTTDVVESPTEAELLLSGENSVMRSRIAELGIQASELTAVRQAEAAMDLLEHLESVTPEDSRLLARVLGAINGDPAAGASAKSRAVAHLACQVSGADAAFISTLRNLNSQPFPDRLEPLATAVSAWTATHLPTEPKDILNWAVEDAVEDWWLAAVRNGFEKAVQQWRPGTAEAIWTGIAANPSAARHALAIVPDHVAAQLRWTELAIACPKSLPHAVASEVAGAARRRGSVELFAAATDAALGTAAAVDALLEPDWSDAAPRGWTTLVDRRGPADLIALAVERTSEALLTFAGALVAAEPSLREPLDPLKPGWRTLWLRSIMAGAGPWTGIPSPAKVRDALFDATLDGEPVDPTLLTQVAQSEWGDLRTYSRQAEVWAQPGFPGRAALLAQTARAWIASFADEPEITALPHEAVLGKIRSAGRNLFGPGGGLAGDFRVAIAAFERISGWQESHFLDWLAASRLRLMLLAGDEGIRMGRLVARQNWSRAARELFAERRASAGVRVAVEQCVSLLGILDQIRLTLETPGARTLDPREWYDALFEFVVQNYQRGPEDRGVWQRAGGNLSYLSGASPRDRWRSALAQLRAGQLKDISTRRLLDEMRDDLRHNPDLKLLDEAYRKRF